jgi:hypothetical protein
MSNAYITSVLSVIGRSLALLLVGGAQLPGTSGGMSGGAAFTAAASSVTSGLPFCAKMTVDALTRATAHSSLHHMFDRLLLICYGFMTAPRTYFFLVSFSFSRQMNSIRSVSGISVTCTVVPHGLV